MRKISLFALTFLISISILSSCNNADKSKTTADKGVLATQPGTPEYFNLRPKLGKDYGYSHAVKIGDDLPTGTRLEVKGLAVAGQLIEIDMEAHKTK